MSVISKERVRFLQGNTACSEAAIVSGMRFFAGYPITPSTEIAERLSHRLPQVGGKFIQMEDEIASIAAVLGASLAGIKAMTATSGPGFSLMQELIGFASLCEIPAVIVNVQRGGPSTGLPTSPSQGDVMQSRWGTHGDHPIIVLSPTSVKETYDLTIKAFNFSEELRVPVILLMDEVIAHMREKIMLPSLKEIEIINRKLPTVKPKDYKPYTVKNESDVPIIANFGQGYRFNVTGLIHDETGFPTRKPSEVAFLLKRLYKKIEARRKKLTIYQTLDIEDAKIVLLSYGSAFRSALAAYRILKSQGYDIGLIKINTIWPFPEEVIKKLPSSIEYIVVIEMNLGQLVREVERTAYGRFKIRGVHIADGQLISPLTIIEAVKHCR